MIKKSLSYALIFIICIGFVISKPTKINCEPNIEIIEKLDFLELESNSKIEFYFDGKPYVLFIENISDSLISDSVTMKLDELQFVINSGKVKCFDLDNDGVVDFSVILNKVNESNIDIDLRFHGSKSFIEININKIIIVIGIFLLYRYYQKKDNKRYIKSQIQKKAR